MKIYIELIFLFILGIIILGWKFWDTKVQKKEIRNYDENKNKSRKPGNFRTGLSEASRTEQTNGTKFESSDGLEEPRGRKLLQTTAVDEPRKELVVNGKNSPSSGKKHSRLRNLFKRRRRN